MFWSKPGFTFWLEPRGRKNGLNQVSQWRTNLYRIAVICIQDVLSYPLSWRSCLVLYPTVDTNVLKVLPKLEQNSNQAGKLVILHNEVENSWPKPDEQVFIFIFIYWLKLRLKLKLFQIQKNVLCFIILPVILAQGPY